MLYAGTDQSPRGLITPKSNTKILPVTTIGGFCLFFYVYVYECRKRLGKPVHIPHYGNSTKCNAQRKHSWSGYTVTDMMKGKMRDKSSNDRHHDATRASLVKLCETELERLILGLCDEDGQN